MVTFAGIVTVAGASTAEASSTLSVTASSLARLPPPRVTVTLLVSPTTTVAAVRFNVVAVTVINPFTAPIVPSVARRFALPVPTPVTNTCALASLAPMVTLDGAVNTAVSALSRINVNDEPARLMAREITTDCVPPTSTVAGVTTIAGSVTVTACPAASGYPAALARNVTAVVSGTSPVIKKVAADAPAGIVTLPGADNCPGRSLLKLTTRLLVVDPVRVTVIVAVSPATTALPLAKDMDNTRLVFAVTVTVTVAATVVNGTPETAAERFPNPAPAAPNP